MAKRPNDDLFEGTTMSFGEHLEELRTALFKSVIGLVIGALLGMLVANWVVRQIQAPLERSLKKFYINKAQEEIKLQYPGEVPDEVLGFLASQRLTFEEVYFEKSMLRRFSVTDGDLASETASESTTTDDAATPPRATSTGSDDVVDKASDAPSAWAWVLKYLGYGPAATSDYVDSDLERVVQEKLPAPDSHMIKTRIWRPIDIRITALSAQEVFVIWMKAALIAGLVITSPWIFYQIWHFVAAGLYPHEKNYVYLYLPFSLGLFLAGAAMAFFFVFDPVLGFLFHFNKSMGIDPDPRINEWLSFVLYMPLGFGLSFQLPLVMLFLNRIGLFSIEAYLSKWRIAILTIFVISMVLTPADPYSMLLMALPLTVLYFVGVLLCRWMPRGRNPFDVAYDA